MKEKIKEAVSLYRKENKVVENGSAIMLQRLPIEDKKKAREMLDQIPKEILIQYILENVG